MKTMTVIDAGGVAVPRVRLLATTDLGVQGTAVPTARTGAGAVGTARPGTRPRPRAPMV